MKKNFVFRQNNCEQNVGIQSQNSRVQKFLSLERHPRQRQEQTSIYNCATSYTPLMF